MENIAAAKEFGACDTVVPATDTIVEALDNTVISNIPDRSKMYQGQTPQSFKALKLKNMYDALTEEEKKEMCRVVTESGADFIKTSTGFSKAGATFADIALFAAHVGSGVKMKAAGGISSLEDAGKFLELGAHRLGTSRMVKLVPEKKD